MPAAGPSPPAAGAPSGSPAADLQVLHVQGNVHVIAGAGGNVAVQVGEDGVLLVDAGAEPMSERVLAAVRKLSTAPIRYIVNTHQDADHIGGNAALAAAGASLGAARALEGAEITAHENVLLRLSKPAAGGAAAVPYKSWPTATYVTGEKPFSFNAEAVVLMHQPAAHTDGDTMVFFRGSDVISTGDIFVTTSFPVIDAASGGTLQGIIDALNHVLRLAVPRHNQEGGTDHRSRTRPPVRRARGTGVSRHARNRPQPDPRHGRPRRVARRGEAVAADARLRRALRRKTGNWTSDAFVEAIYRELSNGRR